MYLLCVSIFLKEHCIIPFLKLFSIISYIFFIWIYWNLILIPINDKKAFQE